MIRVLLLSIAMIMTSVAHAAEYKIDTEGAHAFIQFRIKHLGYSWLYGRFNDFEGSFSYNPDKPEASSVKVTIDMASIDSNHAERDRHLRGKDFFEVSKYPKATFVSSSYTPTGDGKGVLEGTLTLRGVSKDISIDVERIGGGTDPWGGVRQGFTGSTEIVLKDFNIDFDLGPEATRAEVLLDIEGIRQ